MKSQARGNIERSKEVTADHAAQARTSAVDSSARARYENRIATGLAAMLVAEWHRRHADRAPEPSTADDTPEAA